MMDDFMVRALVAGIGVAAVMGPLGALVVWRRMAFFGAAVAHSALFGIALGFVLGIAPTVGMIAVCAAMAVLLVTLHGRGGRYAEDTLLGILAHAALALGLVAIAFVPTLRVDLVTYLFGDILAVSLGDIAWIYAVGTVALAVLWRLWRPLIAITVDAELARVEGIRVGRDNLVFMLLIAVLIAVAMKVVGLLLVAAMLVIPAAAARPFARTPEQMAALASAIGCLAVAGGLGGSALWDLPSGPAIVVAATLLFAAAALRGRIARAVGRPVPPA